MQNGSWLTISQEAAPFHKERGSYSCLQTEVLGLTSSSFSTGFQLDEGASLFTICLGLIFGKHRHVLELQGSYSDFQTVPHHAGVLGTCVLQAAPV